MQKLTGVSSEKRKGVVKICPTRALLALSLALSEFNIISTNNFTITKYV